MGLQWAVPQQLVLAFAFKTPLMMLPVAPLAQALWAADEEVLQGSSLLVKKKKVKMETVPSPSRTS